MSNKIDHLILLGRPASGKSEFIDFIKGLSDTERNEICHIAKFEEIDDFPWIWEKFVEDDLWERAGYPRRYSKEYMKGNPGVIPEGAPLFDFCMEMFNREIKKKYLSNSDFYKEHTLIIEFSRGGKKKCTEELPRLAPEIWKSAAILYIDVSRDDSWRRNVARYEEKAKHSILAHMVPKETYDHYYNEIDWADVTGGKESGFIEVHGMKIPFVSMNNEPELPPGPEIAERYKKALDKLYELYSTGDPSVAIAPSG